MNKVIAATQERLDKKRTDMSAQKIAKKLKEELPHLIQPSEIDKALVEVYNDVLHLTKCIDPFDTDLYTYNILRKYHPDFSEKHPMDK